MVTKKTPKVVLTAVAIVIAAYILSPFYLKEGGQNYDVMGWNQEQLINDILDQYEKHLHFLHLVR